MACVNVLLMGMKQLVPTHDNASTHQSLEVKKYLAMYNVMALEYSPYFPIFFCFLY
jgi:hypothetical protein